MTFEYYQDVKQTIYRRYQITITADSKEEAEALIKKELDIEACHVEHKQIEVCDGSELLYDLENYMTPEENDGYATIEVYSWDDNEIVYANGIV